MTNSDAIYQSDNLSPKHLIKANLSNIANSKITFFLGVLIFLFPACAVTVDHGASTVYALIILFSIFGLSRVKTESHLSSIEKELLIVFFLFFAWALILWLIGDTNYKGFKRVSQHVRFIAFIPAFFLLRRVLLSSDWLWFGLTAGALGAGFLAVSEVVFGIHDEFLGRAGGASHPILFGDLSLIMGVMAIARYASYKTFWAKSIVVSAFCMGLLASLLSGSRGGWIALPVLALIVIIRCWPVCNRSQRWLISLAPIVVVMLLFGVQGTGVAKKFHDASVDIMHYEQGDLSENSVGLRFEMWRAASLMFREHPVIGVGITNYYDKQEEMVNSGIISQEVLAHGHPHNTYLSALSSKGIIGLILVCALFLYPLRLFMQYRHSTNAEVRNLSYAGILMISGYLIFGLSESMFYRVLPISFYTVLTMSLTAFIISNEKHNQHS